VSVFMSARQLGHSVSVAERHYRRVHRGIPREAPTLEAAMQIELHMSALRPKAKEHHDANQRRSSANEHAASKPGMGS
jgi:hypothetical protein